MKKLFLIATLLLFIGGIAWAGPPVAPAPKGTAAELTAGTNTISKSWSAKILGDYSDAAVCLSEAELTAAIAGSKGKIIVGAGITLTGNATITQDLYINNDGSIDIDGNTLDISGHLEAGPYQIFSDTDGGGTIDMNTYQDTRLIWFPTSDHMVASAAQGTTVWVDGQIDLDTMGGIDSDTILHIKGHGWADEGSNAFVGSELLWTGDGPAIEFSPASELEGASVEDLVIMHGGDTDAAILYSNVIRTKTENVEIRCYDDGDGYGYGGIRYTNNSYFSYAENVTVNTFDTYGIYIDSSATGSEYVFNNCSALSAVAGNEAGLKSEGRPIKVYGGEWKANNTDGIGIHIYNGTGSTLYDNIFEDTATGITIEGSGATTKVVVYNPRGSLDSVTDRLIYFGDSAYGAIVYNPNITATGSADMAEWHSGSQQCGLVGGYRNLIDDYTVTVDASTYGAYVQVLGPGPVSPGSMDDIITDSNLTVYAGGESSRYHGAWPPMVHTGSNWNIIEQHALSNDTSFSFDPPWDHGIILVTSNNGTGSLGIVSYVDNALVHIAGADVEVTTGVLEGTTGSDNKQTLSLNSGTMYYENRIGAGAAPRLYFFGVD